MKYLVFGILALAIVITSCKPIQTKNNERFYPKKGELSFVKENVIKDKDVYQKSLDSFKNVVGEALKRQVIKEREMQNIPYDSTILNQLVEFSKASLERMLFQNDSNIARGKMTYRFQDSIIISDNSSSYPIHKDYTIINRKKGTYYKLSKDDSITVYKKNTRYYYKNENNITIKEYPNITKNIKGFECFRVLVTVPENVENSDEEFMRLFENAKTTYDLYVTDKIKCVYHPFFKYKSILEKYYPLEIIEKSLPVKAFETQYKLTKFTIR